MELPRVVPDELGHDVLRWGYEFVTHHYLLHVRDNAVVAWNVQAAIPEKPRATLPNANAISTWMASITDDELAVVTPAQPKYFNERHPVAELPFSGFAIVHSSVATYSISKLDTDLLGSRTWFVFPCDRSEVARDMDNVSICTLNTPKRAEPN